MTSLLPVQVAKDNGPATYRVLQRILGNVDV